MALTPEEKATGILLPGSKGSIWRAWMVSCQARFGYFIFLVVLFTITGGMAISVHTFFLTFMPENKGSSSASASDDGLSTRFSVGVMLFPIGLFICAWVFDQVMELWADTLNLEGGGMGSFRLALTTVIHCIRHWRWFLEVDSEQYRSMDNPPEDNTRPYGYAVEVVNAGINDGDYGATARSEVEAELPDGDGPGLKELTTPKHDREHEGPWPIDDETHRIVDVFVPVIFDAIVVISMIVSCFTNQSLRAGLLSFVEAGFVAAVIYTMAWVVLNILVNVIPKMYLLMRLLEERQEMMEQKVTKLRLQEDTVIMGYRLFRSMSMKSCKDDVDHLCPTDIDMAIESEFSKVNKDWEFDMYNKYPLRSFIFYLIAYLVAVMVTYVNLFVGFYLIMIVVWFLGGYVRKVTRSIFNGSFRGFLGFFVIFSTLCFTMVALSGARQTSYIAGMGIKPPVMQTDQYLLESSGDNPFAAKTGTSSYEICSYDYNKVTIIDMIMLSDAAYSAENMTSLEHGLSDYFTNTTLGDYEIIHVDTANWVVFYEIYFPRVDTSVIAVRGTTTPIDILKDLQYWFGIGILQIISRMVMPLMSQLPDAFIAWMLYLTTLPGVGPPPIYEVLVDYVAKRRAILCPDPSVECNLFLTGHSLGGGMAAIAGTRTHTNVISISGPGVKYTHRGFGIEEEDIADYVFTLVPDNDLVPRTDVQAGMVQEISCPTTSPLDCHLLTATICTMFDSCGDLHNRNWLGSGCTEMLANAEPDL